MVSISYRFEREHYLYNNNLHFLKLYLILYMYYDLQQVYTRVWKVKTKSDVFNPISNIEYPFCILFKDLRENKKYMPLK